MENTILRKTKILYDNDFVIIRLIENDEWYSVLIQIDEDIAYLCACTKDSDYAYECYHECLVDIFSSTFEEIMEEFQDRDFVEKVYEEALRALNLSKEMFGHKKPSEIFSNMNDVSRVEMVMKHSTFQKLIGG